MIDFYACLPQLQILTMLNLSGTSSKFSPSPY